MKTQITFVIETGATGRNDDEIQDEAVKIGTSLWLKLKAKPEFRDAALVSVTAQPEPKGPTA